MQNERYTAFCEWCGEPIEIEKRGRHGWATRKFFCSNYCKKSYKQREQPHPRNAVEKRRGQVQI